MLRLGIFLALVGAAVIVSAFIVVAAKADNPRNVHEAVVQFCAIGGIGLCLVGVGGVIIYRNWPPRVK